MEAVLHITSRNQQNAALEENACFQLAILIAFPPQNQRTCDWNIPVVFYVGPQLVYLGRL